MTEKQPLKILKIEINSPELF